VGASGICVMHEEIVMPTTIPVAFPTTSTIDKLLATINNPELIVVTIFSTAGLLVAILFAAYLPLSDDLAVLLNLKTDMDFI
jgi:hypothetical protein